MTMIYAVPEIRSDVLLRAYVEEVFGRPLVIEHVLWTKQTPVDEVSVDIPRVKVAGRVT
jgi:hypothetical protein